MSFEWNSIRLGGLAHGIVTKTVHNTPPGVVGVNGVGGGGGLVGGGGLGVVRIQGGGGQGWWWSRVCSS